MVVPAVFSRLLASRAWLCPSLGVVYLGLIMVLCSGNFLVIFAFFSRIKYRKKRKILIRDTSTKIAFEFRTQESGCGALLFDAWKCLGNQRRPTHCLVLEGKIAIFFSL